jgi:dolichol-phosphate mannosyltransferase
VTEIRRPEVSIVIPAYQEGENIIKTLAALRVHVRTPHEILVVYDFDEDSTVAAVHSVQDQETVVRLVKNSFGRGALNAMRAGIRAALGRYVVITMADGSDDVTQVDRMVERGRSGADLVAASRYMRGGRQIGGPRLKRLLSRTAGLSLHHLFGLPIRDATNSFKLYSRRFLDSVTIESRGGFELGLELAVKAALAGRPMAEIPTTWRDRSAGESRFRLAAWLPHYLRWYLRAAYGALTRGLHRVSKRESAD